MRCPAAGTPRSLLASSGPQTAPAPGAGRTSPAAGPPIVRQVVVKTRAAPANGGAATGQALPRLPSDSRGWSARHILRPDSSPAVTPGGSSAAMLGGLARTTRLEDAALPRTRQRQIERTARAGVAGRLIPARRKAGEPRNAPP
jgi:hypothetical protein